MCFSPPGTVEDKAKETRHTDENGEIVIELSAGDSTDIVMYCVEVRDQKKTLGILVDEYEGVQEGVRDYRRERPARNRNGRTE